MEEKGVSFGDILQALKKNWIMLVVVTVIVAIVGSLLFYYVYNKSSETYSYSFEINSDAIVDGKYPDGSVFRYEDMISYDSLKAIVESNDEFASIDYSGLLENDNISISDSTSDSTDSAAKVYKVLTVYKKYFSSKVQASKFMKAIINAPVEKANLLTKSLQYDANLEAYAECKTSLENKLSYLKAQKEYLVKQYEDLGTIYDSKYSVTSATLGSSSGKTLDNLKTEVENAFTEKDYNKLLNTIKTKYFVLDKDSSSLLVEKAALEKEQKENSKTIEELEKEYEKLVGYLDPATSDVIAQSESSFQSKIATLVVRNLEITYDIADIEEQLKTLDPTYDATEYNAFVAEMEEYATSLEEKTTIFTSVKATIIETESTAILKSNMPTADGGMSIYLEIIISILIGFVLAAIIACIKDLPKIMKEKNAPVIASVPEEKKED